MILQTFFFFNPSSSYTSVGALERSEAHGDGLGDASMRAGRSRFVPERTDRAVGHQKRFCGPDLKPAALILPGGARYCVAARR